MGNHYADHQLETLNTGDDVSRHLRRWYDSYKRGTLKSKNDAIVLPQTILEELAVVRCLETK